MAAPYEKILDNLLSIKQTINKQDVDRFVKKSIFTYTMDINSSFVDKTDETDKINMIRTLAEHDIVDLESYITGFRLYRKVDTIFRAYKHVVRKILCNIDTIKMDNKQKYLTFILLTYDYMPINTFEKEFAMYDGFTQEDLGSGVTMNMITYLQQKYKKIKNPCYLNLLNILLRIESSGYDRLAYKIEGNRYSLFAPTYEAKLEEIFMTIGSYYHRAKRRYSKLTPYECSVSYEIYTAIIKYLLEATSQRNKLNYTIVYRA